MSNIVNVARRENKTCYLLGDYNINFELWKPCTNCRICWYDVKQWFLPLITRPSRVTATSATLIDNMFTNDMGDINNYVQGLFITDISDHFPAFHIARQMEIKEKDTYIFKMLYSFQNKENCCQAIGNISWDEISRTRDTRQAFDTFHKHLVEIYNKHFPKIRIIRKYNNRKQWLSEGLKNSIKNKQTLSKIKKR